MSILLIILIVVLCFNVAHNIFHGVNTGSILSFVIAGVNFFAFFLVMCWDIPTEKKAEVDGDGNTIESPKN